MSNRARAAPSAAPSPPRPPRLSRCRGIGKLGDGMDDRRRAVAGEQVLDEAAVDLELVEREALQIAQRRIAGAEIVERNAHAERAQGMEQPQRGVAAIEEDRFSDFDLEPL